MEIEREKIGQGVATGSDLFRAKMLLEYLLVCLKRNCYSLVERGFVLSAFAKYRVSFSAVVISL